MWSEEKNKENVIAIFLADVHLSLKPPIWRSAEPDWLEAQYRPIEEVRLLKDKYKCPVICAGDMYHRWNCSPELINYALGCLPDMYSIPGQHDLPLHQYEDIHRSAYLTLVKAGKILNVLPDCLVNLKNITLQGFPFGYEIEPCSEMAESDKLHIAAVHKYIWIEGHSYHKAQPQDEIKKYLYPPPSKKIIDGKLYGYDIIVYGDNHSGFQTKIGKTTIFNCGTLMRRRSDEIDYRPQIGLLLESGKVIPHYLDTSEDKYLDVISEKANQQEELDMASFMKELEKLGKTALDFKDAMVQFLHQGKTSDQAKQIILKAMEK